MLLPAVLLVVLGAAPVKSPSRPAPGLPQTKADSGSDIIALPMMTFSSDHGISYGAVGGIYLYGPGKTPYAHGIGAQVLFSSRGVQSHYVRYDGPRLIGPLRLEAGLEYRRELKSPFFGAGNLSAPDFRGDLDNERYTFDKGAPGGWFRLRGRPFGPTHPLQSYVGYALRYTSVDTYDESMLHQQRPLGIEGGMTGQLLVGALWDTRDDETDPLEGGVEEIALRVSGMATGSRYQYAGITLSERRYLKLSSRLTLAQRLTLDMLFGEVPFFEWSNTGGVNVSEGIGGMSSVRGIERNRFSGNVKAFSNTELRYHAANLQVFGKSMKVGAVMFLDLGRVWHPGVPDGKWHEWHPGIGGGLRLMRRAAVVRMDYARSTETGRQRVYITFGHMF